jgi:NTP pyrophosphatase (non-canonical NTP hydrolase)
MEFQTLIGRAMAIRKKYALLEKEQYGREWTGEEIMLGYMKDIGDLAKLVQAKEGIRPVENVDDALAHELSDCIWSAIVLADKYGVDLEKSFTKTMDELEGRLS